MNPRWNKIQRAARPVFRVLAVLCAGFIFLLLSVAGLRHQSALLCAALDIRFTNDSTLHFLEAADIKTMLRNTGHDTLLGKPLEDIDFNRLEEKFNNHPYILRSRIFADAHGNIEIRITQRQPILRIINNKGVGYYLDENGSRMPLTSKFTARVPVATGNIKDRGTNEDVSDTALIRQLYQLALFIEKDPFLRSNTQQIVVTDNQELQLIPQAGNFVILLGDASGLQEKSDKLKAFYLNGAGNGKTYRQVDLRFLHLVYALDKNYIPKPGTLFPADSSGKTSIPADTLKTKPHHEPAPRHGDKKIKQ